MKIQKILSQHRRDFTAIFECESCGHTMKSGGYDDANFHQNIIPHMPCKQCGKQAPEDYRALTTKYPEHVQV